jgi:hypothetical protein
LIPLKYQILSLLSQKEANKVRHVKLKKLRRVEGGAKNVGVFRVKHYDFTPKSHIFSNGTIPHQTTL